MAADRTAQRRDRNRESKPGSSRAPEFGEDHLLALQCELTGRGVKCELDVRPAWPRLRIHGPCEISRAVAEFENSVVAVSYSDGWWFSWPWAEKISPVTDVSAAAERIAREIGPDGGSDGEDVGGRGGEVGEAISELSEPVVRSWGCRDGTGLSVSLVRRDGQLVITISAPAGVPDLEPFIAGGAERGTPHVSRNVLDT